MANVMIIDGDTQTNPALEESISALARVLRDSGHTAKVMRLAEKRIAPCVGCFDCWLKTPGLCRLKDDMRETLIQWLQADVLVLASSLKAGFVSAELKTMVDRFLPLAHPYIEVVRGEMMHVHRYEDLPIFATLLAPGPDDDARQLRIVQSWVDRTAYQTRGSAAFHATPEDDPLDLLKKLGRSLSLSPEARWQPITRPRPGLLPQCAPRKEEKLLIINASLRAESNTAFLMRHLQSGFERAGGSVELWKISNSKTREQAREAFERASLVLFALPLYVHAMPGQLQAFFEMLEELPPRPDRRIGFFVQFGFQDTHQARWLERHLQRLPQRWGSENLGVVIRAGAEGVQAMPPSWNKKLFHHLDQLGENLALQGHFEAQSVSAITRPEHLSWTTKLLLRAIDRFIGSRAHWDRQLKKNGAFEERFATPLKPPPKT